MHDLVNVALRTLMCLAFLIWVVRPMLFALSRREPNQLEIEEVVEFSGPLCLSLIGRQEPAAKLANNWPCGSAGAGLRARADA